MSNRSIAHPGIKRDARALGVNRITLWRALVGRGKNPARQEELVARYRSLVAARQSQEERGIVLSPGFSFRPTERRMAEQLASAFPESLTLRGWRLEVISPLILSAPSHGPSPAACPSQTSLIRRVASAAASTIRRTARNASPASGANAQSPGTSPAQPGARK